MIKEQANCVPIVQWAERKRRNAIIRSSYDLTRQWQMATISLPSNSPSSTALCRLMCDRSAFSECRMKPIEIHRHSLNVSSKRGAANTEQGYESPVEGEKRPCDLAKVISLR